MKFMKRWLSVMLIAILPVVAFGCSAATADFTVTSSSDLAHTHNVVISGKDVDAPPAADKILTSDGASHTHKITITPAMYQSVKAGQAVTVISTSDGATPHTHTFTIKKP
jgi:hypothetical protein